VSWAVLPPPDVHVETSKIFKSSPLPSLLPDSLLRTLPWPPKRDVLWKRCGEAMCGLDGTIVLGMCMWFLGGVLW